MWTHNQLPTPRPELANVQPEPHGGLDAAELRQRGLDPERVLDFSACVNPFGPAPGVAVAIAQAPLDRYPDRGSRRLRAALAEWNDIPPSHLLVGNGSSELIGQAALAFIRPGDKVLVLGPTYGEYARAARLMGAEVVACNTDAACSFTVNDEAVARALADHAPRLVFVCNPNNPTGTLLPNGLLADWAGRCPDTLFVVDEAYLAFAQGADSACPPSRANILVLRSLTKDHALAGVRLGYAVGHPAIIAALARVGTPWSVSTLAESAGLAALHDRAHLERTLGELRQAKAELVNGLIALGMRVLPSTTHYFLIEVGNAKALRERLLQNGVLVRDSTSFGLPGHVRVATRKPQENRQLLAALRAWRDSTGASSSQVDGSVLAFPSK